MADTVDDSTPQVSPLMELPAEVVYKILTDYEYIEKDLRTIRLVCRQTNESVKHVALHHLKLVHKREWALKQMASQHSTFDEVTKVLTLGRAANTSLKRQAELQDVICRIIKKLKHVHTVYWDLSNSTLPPSDNVACIYEAVSQLPSLEKLVLKKLSSQSFPGADERNLGQKFAGSKLKSISIEIGTGFAGTMVIDNLRALLTAQLALEELNTWNYSGVTAFDFAAIVGEIPLQQGFKPSLRALYGVNLGIAPTPSVVKYLANLTSLCISNLHPDHDTLWPAFHKGDITLRTVIIERPTERLTDYLLGYRGLEKLVLTDSKPGREARAGATGNTKHRFLEEGVQHHSNSLCELEIRFLSLSDRLLLWGLDRRQLVWLEAFPKLTKLAVSFIHDASRAPKGTKISMEDALNGLFTRLTPTLRWAELVCGMSTDYGKYGDRSDYGLVQSVRSFEFIAQPRNPSDAQLHLFDAIWLICYDQRRKKYHFMPKLSAAEE